MPSSSLSHFCVLVILLKCFHLSCNRRASLVFSGVLDIFCAAKSCFLVLFLSVELQLCSNLKVVCRTCQFQTCLSEHKVNYFKVEF